MWKNYINKLLQENYKGFLYTYKKVRVKCVKGELGIWYSVFVKGVSDMFRKGDIVRLKKDDLEFGVLTTYCGAIVKVLVE